MLSHLEIRDFAIIDSLSVRFGPGLTAITGETGAGKSIIVDALGAVLGDRTSSMVVRSGARTAVVDAAFDLEGSAHRDQINSLLTENGISADDDHLILTREISASGRTMARVNGRPITVGLLAQLGSLLVDIHGQSEHLSLLRADIQARLLDDFGVDRALLDGVSQRYDDWRTASDALRSFHESARDRTDRLDLLRYQVDELEAIGPLPGEDEALEIEISRLTHASRLHAGVHEALVMLSEDEASGEDELQTADSQIRQSGRTISSLVELDSTLTPISERLNELLFLLGDINADLRNYAGEVESDPTRLDEAVVRLDLIVQAKRKYGTDIQGLLAHLERSRDELERLGGNEASEEALAEAEVARYGALQSAAIALSKARTEAAERLTIAAAGAIRDLQLGDTSLTVAVASRLHGSGSEASGGRSGIDRDGADVVEFLFAPNPGEPPRPLAKIASGGEMARVMLALKSVLAEFQAPATLVFDEVDVGIGGRSAQPVGQKLAALAGGRQVIVITHLPQVAGYADLHLRISKSAAGGRSRTEAIELTDAERIDELAAMLDGLPITAASRTKAAEILQRATGAS